MSLIQATLSGSGNLIKLLPTGTVFLFQYLTPLLTNNGKCNQPINKYSAGVLLAACGLSCFFSSFTDSYIDDDGVTQCGIVTRSGLWCPAAPLPDSAPYRLRFTDFVHAFGALVVFGVVVLLDSNSVHCFYPSSDSTPKMLRMALPPFVGFVTGVIFVSCPNTRRGIGYTTPS